MLPTPIHFQATPRKSEVSLDSKPVIISGSGEITPGLFTLTTERMRAYGELLQQNQNAILTIIHTGIEADLFSLLLTHLHSKTKRAITHITLLPSPRARGTFTAAERETQQQYDRSRFAQTFQEIISGNFSRLQHLSFAGYPLWPTEWTEFFDAFENRRFQVKNLNLSIEACEASETAVIRFLSKVSQGVFGDLQTLVISGWKDSQYISLATQIEYGNLPSLAKLVWSDCPKLPPGELPQGPHAKAGTMLLLTLRNKGFTQITGPEKESVFSRENKQ